MNALTAAADSRFELIERLGAGAFGEVYRAHDRARDVEVAVKILKLAEGEALLRFKRELRALGDLTHPNLLRVHELVHEQGRWLLVMDMVEGVDFVSAVRGVACSDLAGATLGPGVATPEPPVRAATGSVDTERLRAALAQLAAGLAALHGAGHLHRDLKPSNVLVGPTGRVVLLDFGLVGATSAQGAAETAAVLGTPATMAPEQAAGRPATPASDWYAVGVILFEALTGRLPFVGEPLLVLAAKRERDPPDVRQLCPDAPEDLTRLATELLSRDPARRPGAAAVLAVAGLPAPPAVAIGGVTGPGAPFVGRSSELARLAELARSTRRGGAQVALVEGPSGIGKTALVERFLATLPASVFVLRGRCYEQERVPFKAFDGVVDDLARQLRSAPRALVAGLVPRDVRILERAFPTLSGVPELAAARRRVDDPEDEAERRRRAFGALRELLARLAAERPLVIHIDDLQWGDIDSAELWRELVRPPDAPALLLVGSFRAEVVSSSPFLARLLAPPVPCEPERLLLGPLGDDDVRAMVRALLDPERSDAAVTETAVVEAAGSPFLVARLATPFGRARGSLVGALAAEVAELGAASRALLEVVAVAGHPVDAALAAAIAGGDPTGRAEADLAVRRLVRRSPRGDGRDLEPTHDRVREVVSASLPEGARRALHGQLARALEACADTEPEALAHHYHLAGDRARARPHALAAADRALAALAFERGVDLLRLALECTDAALPEPEVRRLHVALAGALAAAGHTAEAGRVLVAASAGADPLEALDLRRLAGEHLCIAGRVHEGLALLDAAASELSVPLPRGQAGTLWRLALGRLLGRPPAPTTNSRVSPRERLALDTAWSATIGYSVIDPARSLAVAYQALRRAHRAGDLVVFARALAHSAIAEVVLSGHRGLPRAEAVVAEAEAICARRSDPEGLAYCAVISALCALYAGRFPLALARAEDGERIARDACVGATFSLDFARILQLNALYFAGDARRITRRCPDWLDDAVRRGDFLAEMYLRMMADVFVRQVVHGDAAETRSVLRGLCERFRVRTGMVQSYWQFVGEVAIGLSAADDAPGLWRRVAAAWADLERTGQLRTEYYRIEAHAYRGRVALAHAGALPHSARERTAMLEDVSRCASICARPRAPWGLALADGLRAGHLALRGDREGALATLERLGSDGLALGLDSTALSAQWCAARLRGDALRAERAAAGLDALGYPDPAGAVRMVLPGVA